MNRNIGGHQRPRGSWALPSARSSQEGCQATAHGEPSGAATYPAYPPQSVTVAGVRSVAPAAWTSANHASTSVRCRTLYARGMPPKPLPSDDRLASRARALFPYRASTMPRSGRTRPARYWHSTDASPSRVRKNTGIAGETARYAVPSLLLSLDLRHQHGNLFCNRVLPFEADNGTRERAEPLFMQPCAPYVQSSRII
jgi:hypothetical protein